MTRWRPNPPAGIGSRAAAWMLGLAALAAAAPAQDFRVDLRLDPPDVVGLDELATLTLDIDSAGGERREARPELKFDNLRVASGPSTSNSLRFIDGVASRRITFTWRLQPLAVGRARVHSGVLEIAGEAVELPERQVDVQRTAPLGRRSRRAREPSGDPFFSSDPFESLLDTRHRRRRRPPAEPPKIYLSAEVQPRDPYVGEQVLYTLYLFTQADVRSVNPEELPDFKSFWTRVIPQPDQLQPQMLYLDGERIGKVVLLQRALFARRGGSFEIAPVKARMAALLPDSGPFGSLLPRTRDIVRSSNAVALDVRELPPPPAAFRGAIGQLEVSAELTPRELEVGAAATLSLTLAGSGHLQGLAPPLLPHLPGVEVFPPQQQSQESIRRQSVSGERVWSFVLVPARPGRLRLPPIEVPYFDPARERYLTASTAPLDLLVRGSPRGASENAGSVDPHALGTAVLPAADGGRGPGVRLWLLVIPCALAAALYLARRRRDPGGRRAPRAVLLEHLRKALGETRPRHAAARIEDAWRAWLERRWGIPPGSPSTRWGTLLAQRGAPEKAAAELVKLADDLHYLRYAPELSSTDGLQRELVERSRKLARSLG